MANDYLKSKWRTWFGFFDDNKDGKISSTDMDKAREKYFKLTGLEGEKKAKTDEKFTKWLLEYVMWGKEEIKVDEFVELNNAAFKADKNKFIERMQTCQDIICHFIDTEGDGYDSEKDVVAVYKAFGHDDEDLERKFFQQYHAEDDKVTVEDLAKYWTHYLTSEDSSIPDPVKMGFDGGI